MGRLTFLSPLGSGAYPVNLLDAAGRLRLAVFSLHRRLPLQLGDQSSLLLWIDDLEFFDCLRDGTLGVWADFLPIETRRT
jgi:hypothetical protein